jgi:Bacterial extracellular solute-binding protein, family 7
MQFSDLVGSLMPGHNKTQYAEYRERPMLVRRNLIAAGIGLAAGLAAPAIRRATAKGGQSLRIGYILPQQSQLGAGAMAFVDEVAKRTGGRIAIEQHPDSTLGGEVEMMKGVSSAPSISPSSPAGRCRTCCLKAVC